MRIVWSAFLVERTKVSLLSAMTMTHDLYGTGAGGAPVVLKWDPKNLEIRTMSVEKTLEPLVLQVLFLWLGSWYCFVIIQINVYTALAFLIVLVDCVTCVPAVPPSMV